MSRSRADGLVAELVLVRDEVPDWSAFPFALPAIRSMERLTLDPHVTFFIGENGSGKSTLVEAVAVAAGFNAEGGSRNFMFATRPSHSALHRCLRLSRTVRRASNGYFLRAESFYNVATEVEAIPEAQMSHGARSLHEQSHGESFLAVTLNRFGPDGFYVLDEPEAALSLRGQLALLRRIRDLCDAGSQFVVATHSPILLAYPGARIYELGEAGIAPVAYTETEQYQLTRDFLDAPERFLRHVFSDDDPD